MNLFGKKLVSVFLTFVLLFAMFFVTSFAASTDCTTHDFDDGIVSDEPLCTSTGKKIFTCKECGLEKTEILPPAGHVFDISNLIIESKPVGCFEDGYDHYIYYCPVCNELLVDFYEIYYARMEHDWHPSEVITAATCVSPGYMVIKCGVCEITEEVDTQPDLNNHVSVKYIGISDIINCTNGAFSTGNCYDCNKSVTKHYPPTGHNLVVNEIIKEPTCTEPGLAYQVCDNSGCDLNGEVEIPALDHSYVQLGYVEADCGVQGGNKGSACRRCSEFAIPPREFEYFDHDYLIEIVSAADKNNNGITRYTCQNVTMTSMFHTFESEYSLADIVPLIPEKGSFTIDTDKKGVIANLSDITGIYNEDAVFTIVDAANAELDEDNNIIVNDSDIITVLVETEVGAAEFEIEVRVFDGLEIVCEETVETGSVLEFDVIKKPFDEKATDVQWTSSDNSIVFVSDGRLVAVGTGKVTLTATVGELTVSKEITVLASSSAKKVTFIAIDKMHYIIEDYYVIYNGETLYWSDANSVRFKVRAYGTFPFETYIVYMNGEELEPDADGYYTISADTAEVRITVSGAMYEENDEGVAEKVNFWQAIINFFKKILAFFGIK